MAMHHGVAGGAYSFGTSPAESFFAAAMDEARGRRDLRMSEDGLSSRIEGISEADEEDSEAIETEDDERQSVSRASRRSRVPSASQSSVQSPRFGPRLMSPVRNLGASYGSIASTSRDRNSTSRERRPSILSSQRVQHMTALQTPVESTPLLKDTTGADELVLATSAKGEAAVLFSYALPILGTHVLEYSIVVCTVVSLGHLGSTQLAAAALGSLSINVIALSVCQGFCTALDTLCSQAFKSRPSAAGLHALRTAFMLSLLLIPQFIICFLSERILLSFGEEAEVSRLAGLYLRAFAFALPGYNLLEVSRRWLQGQGILGIPTLCLTFGASLNVVLQILLVWGPESTNLGFVGAPIATAISFTVMALISVGYCVFRAPTTCWGGWPSAKVFFGTGLRTNLVFGIAGCALVGSEWLAWECIGFSVSFLGPIPLAAQSVLITTCSLTYQMPMAIGSGAAVRIGNLLGAGLSQQAQLAGRITAVGALIVGVFNSSVLFIFRHQWGALFTSEPEVLKTVASVLPIVAVFQIADCICGSGSGVLRGAGRAPLGAAINVGAYWALALPLAFIFAFAPSLQLGLQGLWLGLALGLFLSAIGTVVVFLRIDYEQEAENARQRMLDGDGKDEESAGLLAH